MNKVLIVDNKKDEKFLRRPAADFDFGKYTKKEINELIKTMKITMEKADGIGLSANQVGLNLRFFVAKVENKFYAVFNPQILKKSSSTIYAEEGCLSIPDNYGEVLRPEKVTLTGYDKNGKKIKIKAWGMLARVFQHEVDHLDGKLFTDHIINKKM